MTCHVYFGGFPAGQYLLQCHTIPPKMIANAIKKKIREKYTQHNKQTVAEWKQKTYHKEWCWREFNMWLRAQLVHNFIENKCEKTRITLTYTQLKEHGKRKRRQSQHNSLWGMIIRLSFLCANWAIRLTALYNVSKVNSDSNQHDRPAMIEWNKEWRSKKKKRKKWHGKARNLLLTPRSNIIASFDLLPPPQAISSHFYNDTLTITLPTSAQPNAATKWKAHKNLAGYLLLYFRRLSFNAFIFIFFFSPFYFACWASYIIYLYIHYKSLSMKIMISNWEDTDETNTAEEKKI